MTTRLGITSLTKCLCFHPRRFDSVKKWLSNIFETFIGVVVEKKLYTYQSHTTNSTAKYHVQWLKNEKQLEHTSFKGYQSPTWNGNVLHRIRKSADENDNCNMMAQPKSSICSCDSWAHSLVLFVWLVVLLASNWSNASYSALLFR